MQGLAKDYKELPRDSDYQKDDENEFTQATMNARYWQ